VEKNKVIGRLYVEIGDKTIETIDIVIAKEVNKKNYLDYLFKITSNLFRLDLRME